VGLADEGRRAVDIGVQGDGLDPCAGLRGDVPYGVDEPHGGLTTVDDGDALEHPTEPFCRSVEQRCTCRGTPTAAVFHLSVYRVAVPCRGQPTLPAPLLWETTKKPAAADRAAGSAAGHGGFRAGGRRPPARPRRRWRR